MVEWMDVRAEVKPGDVDNPRPYASVTIGPLEVNVYQTQRGYVVVDVLNVLDRATDVRVAVEDDYVFEGVLYGSGVVV